MAERTKATSADLRKIATDIDNLDNETSTELRLLKAEAEELRGTNWQSMRSGRSFDQTMIQWNQDVAGMRAALQEIARLMRSTADRYAQAEAANAANVGAAAGAAGGAAGGIPMNINQPPGD